RHNRAQRVLVAGGTTETQALLEHLDSVLQVPLGEVHIAEAEVDSDRGVPSAPDGSPQACLTGLAPLENLVSYQRRAQHVGQCGVEVAGGRVPTTDGCLNLQILTSGGLR